VATGSRVPAGGIAAEPARDRDLDVLMRDNPEEGGMEDIATRLAHLGVLHWRVWADLVYLRDFQNMSLDDPPTRI